MKDAATIIAVLLTFAGYAPYIRDTIRKKTKPHVYTWFTWGLVTAIAFVLQISQAAGVGAFVTLAAAIACFSIFLLGLRSGEKDIQPVDTVCFVLAITAIVFWPFAGQAILAIIVVSIADMLGFIPTIRKSWNKPFEETLISYEMNVLRFILALYALENYNIVTYLYPLTWVIANGAFSIFLIIRRRQLKTISS